MLQDWCPTIKPNGLLCTQGIVVAGILSVRSFVQCRTPFL
jgi:hypothetical protein